MMWHDQTLPDLSLRMCVEQVYLKIVEDTLQMHLRAEQPCGAVDHDLRWQRPAETDGGQVMSDGKHCCGDCIHIDERIDDDLGETYYYCGCKGKVYADDRACEYYMGYMGDDE